MARTKQTARKSTGGKAPRRSAAPPSVALGKGKGVSKATIGRGKGGKGLARDVDDDDVHASRSAMDGVVAPTANTSSADVAEKTAELIASFAASSAKIDVVFAFDTTGSMYCYLEEVRKRIHESVSRLHRDIPEIRIGIIAVGDYCDQHSSYVVKTLDLTRDIDALVRFVTGVEPSGGGDAPEAYELALQTTRALSWEAEPGNRALVVIGDSTPHPPSYTTQSIWWRDELGALVDMGVKVYGVQCNTSVPTRYFYEELAAASGGGFLSLQATSCITEMFLAVCYRQVSESALEAYCNDAVTSGGDVEAKRRLFGQLKSAAPTNSVKRCTEDWYDRAYDRGRPEYALSAKQQWEHYHGEAVLPSPRPAAVVVSVPAAAAPVSEKRVLRRSVRAK